MKNLVCMFLMVFALSVSAQSDKQDWLTDYKAAITAAKTQDKPLLVFAVDGSDSEALRLLEQEFFQWEGLKSMADKVIFLKLDINSDLYAKRMAIHLTKSKTTPALALASNDQSVIGTPLNKITPQNIKTFIEFLNETL